MVIQVDGKVNQSGVLVVDGVEESASSCRHVWNAQPAVDGTVHAGRSTDEASPTLDRVAIDAPRRCLVSEGTTLVMMSELDVVDQQ